MKKTIISGFLALAVLISTGAFFAPQVLAHNSEGRGKKMGLIMKETMGIFKKGGFSGEKMHDILEKNGMVNGKVTSITDNSFKFTARGGEFTANTGANTAFVNKVWDKINFSDIKIDDEVRVAGDLTDKTISAKLVRDISLPITQERSIAGKAISVENGVLKISAGNKEFTVTSSSNTLAVNRIWDKISLADIKTNDKIQVFGSVIGNSVNAKLIKNISLPVAIALDED